MRNNISELQSNAEFRVDRVVQTLDTGYSDVLEECRVQNNGTLHGVCIDERATDGTFHEVRI